MFAAKDPSWPAWLPPPKLGQATTLHLGATCCCSLEPGQGVLESSALTPMSALPRTLPLLGLWSGTGNLLCRCSRRGAALCQGLTPADAEIPNWHLCSKDVFLFLSVVQFTFLPLFISPVCCLNTDTPSTVSVDGSSVMLERRFPVSSQGPWQVADFRGTRALPGEEPGAHPSLVNLWSAVKPPPQHLFSLTLVISPPCLKLLSGRQPSHD